jgi:non-homologous end joining protein Ku
VRLGEFVTFVEFPHRVRASADYESEVSNIVPGANELGLVGRLIETMTDHAFELHRFRDRYMDDLSALIERSVAATDLMSLSKNGKVEKRGSEPVVDDESLMSVLQASLDAAGIGGSPADFSAFPRPQTAEDAGHEQRRA